MNLKNPGSVFCLFVLLSIHLACSSESKAPGIARESLKMQLVDEFKIKLDSTTGPYNPFYQMINEGGKRYLTFFNPINYSIYFYDYDRREFFKRLQLEKSGPHGAGSGVRAYRYLNSDSILVHAFDDQRVYLFNSSGERYGSYSLESEIPRTEYPQSDITKPFYYWDGKLIFNNSGRCNDSKGDPLPPAVVVRNIEANKTERGPEYLLRHIEKPKNKAWPLSFCDVFNAHDPNGIFMYGFAIGHKVIVTDHQGFEKEVDFSSSTVDQASLKPLSRVPSDPLQALKLSSSYAQYGPIYYDVFRKKYYRFANSVVSQKNLDNNYFKPDQNIVVMDEQYNVLGEVKMFQGSDRMVFTEEGINIISGNKKEEDYLNIEVYEISGY